MLAVVVDEIKLRHPPEMICLRSMLVSWWWTCVLGERPQQQRGGRASPPTTTSSRRNPAPEKRALPSSRVHSRMGEWQAGGLFPLQQWWEALSRLQSKLCQDKLISFCLAAVDATHKSFSVVIMSDGKKDRGAK